MCLHPMPLPFRPTAGQAYMAPKPDCHLLIEARPIVGRVRALMDALLRVDLGARIQINALAGEIEVEGRFDKDDACTAIERLGLHLARVQERPRSRRPSAPVSWG